MGILDSIKQKADEVDKSINPFRKVADAINQKTEGMAQGMANFNKTPQQKYEDETKRMNKNNPSFGPTKKVDDSIKKIP
jgi:hypothetical protein